jgi:Family of unknown function (DUF6709)
MGEGFLGKAIRRAGRNSILMGLGGLVIVALLFWAEGRYFYNFFHGPFSIDQATLFSIQNPDARRESFVTIQGDQTLETGFEESDTDYIITAHHPILALRAGDRLLLVKVSKDTVATQFSGELTSVPSDVQGQVLSVLQQRHPELKGRFLPVMLDATSYRFNGYAGIVAGALLGLALVWCFWKGLKWSAKPETHPVWKKLGKYGSAQQLGSQLDAELRSEGGGETFGTAHLTTSWLVLFSAYNIEVMRMADVVWAYPHVVKHYHSGIPTGKSHFVKVFDREGATTMISVKKNVAPNLLQSIQRRVPWAIYGFSADLEQMWKKRRAEFLAAVDQQKKRTQTSPTETKSATDKKELVRV